MTQQTLAAEESGHHRSLASFVKRNIREYGMLLSLIAIMAFFQIQTEGTLLKPINLTNLILQNSYIVIMALGMMLIIVAGHIDLSVGSVCGFVGAVAAVLIVKLGYHWLPVTFFCLALGAAIGAVQGYFVAFWKIPAFIVTLAGMLVFKGLALWILAGQSVGPFPVPFQRMSSGFLPDAAAGAIEAFNLTSFLIGVAVTALVIYFNVKERRGQQAHGLVEEPFAFFLGRNLLVAAGFLLFSYLMASYKGLPNVLIVMFALIVLYAFVTSSMTIGRRIYALGGNEKAARLSGIKTNRLTFYTFTNMGLLAGLAGLIFAARLNTATPKAGLGFELDVIAACFIGGASASGGVGKVVGAVIGAFVMGVMNNGMSILGVGIDLQQVIKGLVLLAAVFLDVYYKNKA
ncbi:multiple monosaccharide ABC transporter permease [Dongia deserti]|uniref:multiple monosaccharide ABC transporter permease n=1 Tax=Dongia deserti TaxID=2268030 RepID=UPI000E65B330|nr:multiple monosaccharide ABC transporter permease [Dongia deserti]